MNYAQQSLVLSSWAHLGTVPPTWARSRQHDADFSRSGGWHRAGSGVAWCWHWLYPLCARPCSVLKDFSRAAAQVRTRVGKPTSWWSSTSSPPQQTEAWSSWRPGVPRTSNSNRTTNRIVSPVLLPLLLCDVFGFDYNSTGIMLCWLRGWPPRQSPCPRAAAGTRLRTALSPTRALSWGGKHISRPRLKPAS